MGGGGAVLFGVGLGVNDLVGLVCLVEVTSLLQTGTSFVLRSTEVCSTGPEISRPLRLALRTELSDTLSLSFSALSFDLDPSFDLILEKLDFPPAPDGGNPAGN